MKAAIIPNITRPNAQKVTSALCEELGRLGVSFSVFEEAAGNDREELIPEADIVIAVGGDGSIIRTAKLASKYGKPVLGVNAGNVAFMAGLEFDEISSLGAIVSGNYVTDRRMMLDVTIGNSEGPLFTDFCLNDVVIGRGREIRIIEAEIFCDGKPVGTYRADGMVFSTPTGSTAYSLSAGGPVAEPTLECIMMAPLAPYTLSSRPVIFGADRKITVRVTPYNEDTVCSCDGNPAVRFDSTMTAEISKSEYFAEFIRIKNEQFWDVLKHKIH